MAKMTMTINVTRGIGIPKLCYWESAGEIQVFTVLWLPAWRRVGSIKSLFGFTWGCNNG